ncbi:MAG: hypothetical protein ACOYBC_03165 [Bilifractor sp.]|jgi:hypothetical protein
MTEDELRKLKRGELLEIMLAQSREIDRLKKQNQELREQVNNRQISLQKSGNIAEASLALTKIFEEAQKAADLYLYNIEKTGAVSAEEISRETDNNIEETNRTQAQDTAKELEEAVRAETGGQRGNPEEDEVAEAEREENGSDLQVEAESVPKDGNVPEAQDYTELSKNIESQLYSGGLLKTETRVSEAGEEIPEAEETREEIPEAEEAGEEIPKAEETEEEIPEAAEAEEEVPKTEEAGEEIPEAAEAEEAIPIEVFEEEQKETAEADSEVPETEKAGAATEAVISEAEESVPEKVNREKGSRQGHRSGFEMESASARRARRREYFLAKRTHQGFGEGRKAERTAAFLNRTHPDETAPEPEKEDQPEPEKPSAAESVRKVQPEPEKETAAESGTESHPKPDNGFGTKLKRFFRQETEYEPDDDFQPVTREERRERK